MIPLDFRSIFSAISGDVALAMSGPEGKEFIAYADVKMIISLNRLKD